MPSSAITISKVTKYYTFGSQRVAMRRGAQLYYLHGDHLGSTSLTTDQNGNKVSEGRYRPYGEDRWAVTSPTDFGFTGQRKDGFGLYDYNARFYSPYLGRFVSPDSVVPKVENPQHWNHYSYVYNNPLKFIDPTGHIGCTDGGPSESDVDGGTVPGCSGGAHTGGGSHDSHSVGGGGAGIRNVGQGGARGSSSEANLVRQAQNAQKQAETLRQNNPALRDKTVAVDANGQRTVSGWDNKGSNFTQIHTDKVFAKGNEVSYTFPRSGPLDQGTPGRFNASHAEAQMSVLSPNKPVGIAGRLMCESCQNFFSQIAQKAGRVQVVADRQVTRIFHPDGRITLEFPELPVGPR